MKMNLLLAALTLFLVACGGKESSKGSSSSSPEAVTDTQKALQSQLTMDKGLECELQIDNQESKFVFVKMGLTKMSVRDLVGKTYAQNNLVISDVMIPELEITKNDETEVRGMVVMKSESQRIIEDKYILKIKNGNGSIRRDIRKAGLIQAIIEVIDSGKELAKLKNCKELEAEAQR